MSDLEFPKKIESKLDFNKPVYIKLCMTLDFTNALSGAEIHSTFALTHEELEKDHPVYGRLVQYSDMQTEFSKDDDLRPQKITFCIDLTTNSPLEYAICKQTMVMYSARKILETGIAADIKIVELRNITLLAKLIQKAKEILDI